MTGPKLIDRPEGARLFLGPNGPIDAPGFLADTHALAPRLPPAPFLINLCHDRYRFMVAFAAALVAGRVSLLCGDPSPALLGALKAAYPGAHPLTDDDVQTPNPPNHHNPTIPGDRLAALVFTSGSTAAPIAHPKTWGELVQRSRAAGLRFALNEAAPATIAGTVPPGHMYGFETTAILPLHAACASWCGPSFFPADVAAALHAAPSPRILVTTPLQLRTLLDTPLPALACCISATAPLDPALAAAAEQRWQAPVLEIFGATECGSIASRRTTDGDRWTPYPGTTLRADGDTILACSADAPPVPLADEVQLDPDGRFRLLGRRTDLVKLGGRRASLAGLNQILTALDGVDDGLFVVPDDLDQRSTARLLALVVAPARSAPSILAELRHRMDPVFLPRRVVHVDALPRNALGKLPRQAILDLLAQSR